MPKENEEKNEKENKVNVKIYPKKTDTSQSSLAKIVAKLNESSRNYAQNQSNIYSTSFEKRIKLEEDINKIKSKLNETLKELDKEKGKSKKTEELQKLLDELNSKEKINHILPRICEDAREKLFSDDEFKLKFENGTPYDSVVVSIDIRRSTELMLKARKPELFSKFITELSEKLSQIIINNFGIFDKFTGDGILAFFPKFYSGENAILRSLKAAQECHNVFNEHYYNSRDCFNIFIKDVGLGIGIDYGNITLVNTSNELTVVGIPVVYACRMSGAKAGDTLLNQPAKEELVLHCKDNLKITETEIEIKNEGMALAYKAEFVSDIILNEDFEWKEPASNIADS